MMLTVSVTVSHIYQNLNIVKGVRGLNSLLKEEFTATFVDYDVLTQPRSQGSLGTRLVLTAFCWFFFFLEMV